MATSYTSLLGLALPVTGELSGTWGDTVNDYITQYLDASIAGTQTISGSQTAVTLSKTTNASLSQAASGATGSSQYQIINCTGNPASLLTITVPAASKEYIVINATSTSQSVKVVGAGPTTGVTVTAGERCLISWNGSDFVKVGGTNGTGEFVTVDTTNLEVTNIKAKDGTASMSIADSTGVASFSANPVLSGGTANGVAYLNGSKVLTTGSALTFDGTNLGVGGTGGSYANRSSIGIDGTNGGLLTLKVAGTENARFYTGATNTTIDTIAGSLTLNPVTALIGQINGSEQMRLTSTGLGIGTSSPATKLDTAGTMRSTGNTTPSSGAGLELLYDSGNTRGIVQVYDRTGSAYRQLALDGSSILFRSSGSTAMTLDSSGNLGLGVTPSAWTAYKAFQIGLDGSLSADAGSSEIAVGQNVRYDGSFKYITTQAASRYRLYNGTHAWFTAPSGTAGNAISFTQVMTLDASGSLTLGQTSSALQSGGTGITLYGASNSEIKFLNSSTGPNATDGTALLVTSLDFQINNREAGAILFGTSNTERARITSGGEFVIGGTSASSGFPLTLDKSTGGGLVLKHNGTDKAYFFLNGSTVSRWETVTGATIEVSSGNSNGVSLANGGTSWGSLSDERKKDIIEPITDAANKVSTLRAVIGKYKTDDEGTRRSFLIAQDVQAVLPEAVVADGSGDLILQYTETIPLLVAAIKEQQAIITDLRARVAALEAA